MYSCRKNLSNRKIIFHYLYHCHFSKHNQFVSFSNKPGKNLKARSPRVKYFKQQKLTAAALFRNVVKVQVFNIGKSCRLDLNIHGFIYNIAEKLGIVFQSGECNNFSWCVIGSYRRILRLV